MKDYVVTLIKKIASRFIDPENRISTEELKDIFIGILREKRFNISEVSDLGNRNIFRCEDQDGSHHLVAIQYDRNLGAHSLPMTMKAGYLFDLICLLNTYDPSQSMKRHLIYITDEDMWKYFMNKSNGYFNIFNLRSGSKINLGPNFFELKAETFRRTIKHNYKHLIELKVELAGKTENKHRVRVFEVNSLDRPLEEVEPVV